MPSTDHIDREKSAMIAVIAVIAMVVPIAAIVFVTIPMALVESVKIAVPFPAFRNPPIAGTSFNKMAAPPNVLALKIIPIAGSPHVTFRCRRNDFNSHWWRRNANFNPDVDTCKCWNADTARSQQRRDQSDAFEWREQPIGDGFHFDFPKKLEGGKELECCNTAWLLSCGRLGACCVMRPDRRPSA